MAGIPTYATETETKTHTYFHNEEIIKLELL
jgi:hypothetical protein